jgi:hypothetical protein
MAGPLRHRHRKPAADEPLRHGVEIGRLEQPPALRVLRRTVIDDDQWEWTGARRAKQRGPHRDAGLRGWNQPGLAAERSPLGRLRAGQRLSPWPEEHTRKQNAESARRGGESNAPKSAQSTPHTHEFLKRRNGFSRYSPA